MGLQSVCPKCIHLSQTYGGKVMFTKVNRYTRGGKNGKQLKCPKCQSVRTIYHFSWSGLTCPECKESIAKYDWLVETRGNH